MKTPMKTHEERIAKIEAALAGRPFYDNAQPKIDGDVITIEDRLRVLERSMTRFERQQERSNEDPSK
jgi:hypothetical protein